MQTNDTIAITGAAGFIGSFLVGYLNQLGYHKLVLVDDFSDENKSRNLSGKKFLYKVHREQFLQWMETHVGTVQYMFHLGARTDTTEMDYEVHKKWNLEYSKTMWTICSEQQIPLVYASSAATYGNGEYGYNDDHDIVKKLKPLNPYGVSKNEFDIWALAQKTAPPFWVGVKFFNVFGPNEYHKGRMASVIFHAYNQIKRDGGVKLFASHNPDYKNGEQKRDFVYVKDVANMCFWLMQNQPENGLYNIGSGEARTFLDLAKAIFKAMDVVENIDFIPTPEDIRDKYQYFTEANMDKLRSAGFMEPITPMEESVKDYIKNYLSTEQYF